MNTPIDLQSVFSSHLAQYQEKHTLTPRQRQVCTHVLNCRTAAMGGMLMSCSNCNHVEQRFHACRDRHCPKCQRAVSDAWVERQEATLLPTTYHHMVFTLPSSLNGWVELHPEVIYHALFKCAWNTLKAFGLDPKRLNGQMGMTAVLHTWGENLSRHVHLHCLVPGGALTNDAQWNSAKSTYLFPVRALSRRFRGLMVSSLRAASTQGQLYRVTRRDEVNQLLGILMRKDWVIYSKPCPTRAKKVIDYLGRYSHRIAISDQRLVSMNNRKVVFSYKDYAARGERKVMALDATEFIRRYLLHVLPKGLKRIRHYGFMANCCREKKLALARSALSQPAKEKINHQSRVPSHFMNTKTAEHCPKCVEGILRRANDLVVWGLAES